MGTNVLAGLSILPHHERGLSGSTLHLVHICSYVLVEDEAMMGVVWRFGSEELIPEVLGIADDGRVFLGWAGAVLREPSGGSLLMMRAR